MARRTKKVKVAGKFGARYGVKARKTYADVMNKKNSKYKCPVCGYKKVVRQDTSIWVCKHCGHTFAGGAYVPRTRIVGKVFSGSSSNTYDNLKERIAAVHQEENNTEETSIEGGE